MSNSITYQIRICHDVEHGLAPLAHGIVVEFLAYRCQVEILKQLHGHIPSELANGFEPVETEIVFALLRNFAEMLR